ARESQRQIADRLRQISSVGSPIHHPGDGAEPAEYKNSWQRRRPRQRQCSQDGENVCNRGPQRQVAPVPPERRYPRSSNIQAHALPPSARPTSDVVLWPGRISISTTSPPAASTIAGP